MFRVFFLLPIAFMALMSCANGEGTHSYSSDFSFSSEAAPHLGGDDFEISSLRLDYGAMQAEQAVVTAFGDILELRYFGLEADAKAPLPQPTPEAKRPAGAPPVISEGQGPVGIAATGDGQNGISMVVEAPKDPTIMRVGPDWLRYRADLEEALGKALSRGAPGVYLQLKPLAGSPSAGISLTEPELQAAPVLSTLFAAPFAFVHIGAEMQLGEFHSVLQLDSGQSRYLKYGGRSYIVTRYDLR